MICSLAFLLVFAACQQPGNISQDSRSGTKPDTPANIAAIPVPEGYTRIKLDKNSMGAYLRNLALSNDKKVYLFDGREKRNQSAQYAVLKIDVGNKDLQQCADAVIRLHAEYLFGQKSFDKITFRLTNGFYCDYLHYAKGYRLVIKGNNCQWIKREREDFSHASFRKYLDLVFSYAGTKSLNEQLQSISPASIEPGSIFLQTGNPYGHAVTVMDMAVNYHKGDTIFLLSQSYMPAQSIHILNNPSEKDISPWYTLKSNGKLVTPEWLFHFTDIKKFKH